MWVLEQTEIDGQTIVVPETISASTTCVSHVTQDGEGKLFEGRGRLGNLLQVWDQSCLCCLLLTGLVDPAKVEQRCQDMVAYVLV